MTSLHEAIDLLEVATSGGEEDEIWTTAGNILCLAAWAHLYAPPHRTLSPIDLLDWLHQEARKHEASVSDGSAAESRTDPEYYEWLNEQGRRIRAKMEEGY